MARTVLQAVASHGTASWLLVRALFIAGLAALSVAAVQTDNPWVWVGVVCVTVAEAVDRRRLSDPDDPTRSWWP